MKSLRTFFSAFLITAAFLIPSLAQAQGQDYSGNEDPNKKIIKNGLLGAGVGAISASASGGKAGQGALIGAGTNVIGGALLDSLTGPSPSQQPQQVVYAQPAQQSYSQPTYQTTSSYPVQTQGTYVPRQEPVYVQQQPVYYQQRAPQEDPSKKIIKQGLLGAGVGAISASASGGNAGKGALIGAGTNVIGGALFDTLLSPSQPQQQPVYVQQQPVYQQPVYQQQQPTYQQSYSQQTSTSSQPKKKIIRKYDKDGNVVSEEEIWE